MRAFPSSLPKQWLEPVLGKVCRVDRAEARVPRLGLFGRGGAAPSLRPERVATQVMLVDRRDSDSAPISNHPLRFRGKLPRRCIQDTGGRVWLRGGILPISAIELRNRASKMRVRAPSAPTPMIATSECTWVIAHQLLAKVGALINYSQGWSRGANAPVSSWHIS